jgi:hypothetical protein
MVLYNNKLIQWICISLMQVMHKGIRLDMLFLITNEGNAITKGVLVQKVISLDYEWIH